MGRLRLDWNAKRKTGLMLISATMLQILFFQNCRQSVSVDGNASAVPPSSGAEIEANHGSNPALEINQNPPGSLPSANGICEGIDAKGFTSYADAGSPPSDLPPLGMNLTGMSYYAVQWMYVDLMKSASKWYTHNLSNGAATDFVDQMESDSNGYALEVPFLPKDTTEAQIIRIGVGNPSYPAGEYLFLAEGQGEIKFEGKGIIASPMVSPPQGSTVAFKVTFQEQHNTLWLKITKSIKGNHLRHIRLIMPGFFDTYEKQPFHPDFLNKLKNYTSLRYMDLMATNNNLSGVGGTRTPPQYYSQSASRRGIAMEYVAALSNVTGTDPWINLPAGADDVYIKEIATQLYCRLNTNRKIYVEYSNELWNGIFEQAYYLNKQGCQDPDTFVPFKSGNDWGVIGCEDLTSGVRYHVKRLSQIYKIFKEVFGSEFDQRVVKLVASQAANTGISDKLLSAFTDPILNPQGFKPDGLAVAPYFAHTVANGLYDNCDAISNSDFVLREKCIADKPLSEFLSEIEGTVTSVGIDRMKKNRLIANKHKVKLFAYEGGQHLVGTQGRENSSALTELITQANRSNAMKDFYLKYYAAWYNDPEVKGDLFMNFSFICPASKWGVWCIYENQTQDVSLAPKAQALLEILVPGFLLK